MLRLLTVVFAFVALGYAAAQHDITAKDKAIADFNALDIDHNRMVINCRFGSLDGR